MWLSALRWIGVNVAALGVGYSASDLFRWIGGITRPEDAEQEESAPTRAARGFGLTGWIAPLAAVAVLTYLAYLFGAFGKRKK